MGTQSTSPLHRRFRHFRKSEEGAITLLGLYIFLGSLVIGALALDVSHLIAARSQLQVAADIAAHTAIYTREFHTAEDSKAKAVELAAVSMPDFGDVINVNDISFGYWHSDTQSFEIDETSRKAVMVKTSRAAERGNSVGSYLFQLVGMTSWDIVTPSVFETYRPICFREGLVGDQVVDMQSGNVFTQGFCVHSNDYVSVSSENLFEGGTIVSMPRISQLDLPASGFATNTGLETSLRSGSYRLGILELLRHGVIEQALLEQVEGNDYERDYIEFPEVEEAFRGPGGKVLETDLLPGHIYTTSCATGSKTLTLNPTGTAETGLTPFRGFILITDCAITFAQDTVLEDVVILTTSTSSKSMTATAGLQVGRDDNCADGGGANLLTFGGMSFPSGLESYSGQFIALGDIDFQAEANGLEGVAMVAGGALKASSDGVMGFCGGSAMDNVFQAEYFRLAK